MTPGNGAYMEKEGKRRREPTVRKLQRRVARKEVQDAERTGGVRPELDRIGELVITEAGDSLGTSAGLPRAST